MSNKGAGILFITREHNLVLLMRRVSPLGQWSIPGGHVDKGETFAQAATRETMEEAGLVSNLQHYDREYTFEPKYRFKCINPSGFVYMTYVQYVNSSMRIRLNGEHDTFAWVPMEVALEWNLHPALKKILNILARK